MALISSQKCYTFAARPHSICPCYLLFMSFVLSIATSTFWALSLADIQPYEQHHLQHVRNSAASANTLRTGHSPILWPLAQFNGLLDDTNWFERAHIHTMRIRRSLAVRSRRRLNVPICAKRNESNMTMKRLPFGPFLSALYLRFSKWTPSNPIKCVYLCWALYLCACVLVPLSFKLGTISFARVPERLQCKKVTEETVMASNGARVCVLEIARNIVEREWRTIPCKANFAGCCETLDRTYIWQLATCAYGWYQASISIKTSPSTGHLLFKFRFDSYTFFRRMRCGKKRTLDMGVPTIRHQKNPYANETEHSNIDADIVVAIMVATNQSGSIHELGFKHS